MDRRGEDDLLSDKGTLADLAHLLGRRNGPLRPLLSGIGALGFAGYAPLVLHDRNAAMLIMLLAVWCFFVAWLLYRFPPE